MTLKELEEFNNWYNKFDAKKKGFRSFWKQRVSRKDAQVIWEAALLHSFLVVCDKK
jgi:hypothetical protein